MAIKCPSCGASCADTAMWCLRCHAVVGSGPAAPTGGAAPVMRDVHSVEERTVGGLLAAGILFFPLIFGWLVLRRGHSTTARVVSLSWMALCVVFVAVRAEAPAMRSSGTAGDFRAEVSRACRDKKLPVDCDCFAADFSKRATVAQVEELAKAPRSPSPAVVEHIEAAARQCADRAALRGSFMSHCVKTPESQALCDCVFDRSLDTFTISEFIELDEAYSNGRPPSPAFGAILNECVANPASRGAVARGPATTPAADATPRSSWVVKSADGRATLEQTQNGLVCTLACSVDAKEIWREPRDCDDTPGNPHFVANDCERWVSFSATVKAAPVLSARFLSVYDRATVAWHVVGAGLVRNQEAVRYQQRHLVAGLGGNAGEPPRYSADGSKVEFTNIEGAPQAVPLRKDAPTKPATKAAPKKRRK